ncbi:hypothetical protein Q4F19_13495 [Sphingomonas sp. BIUV-7]|uniref:Uncharacterized protein n=1 Tax=Sphingomonas natans TaxID=3063330 RepID=A0ABT8YAP3_9SPHN|nr:hypothetical protein [Sphingomonas sp. BIUV-7]MDO6415402.1 hypothetical protein [Sphingomonas sp. BIUV-7]
MDKILVGTGVACLVAAVFGGGMSLLGITFPPLAALQRQVLLFLVGATLLLLGVFLADVQSYHYSRAQPSLPTTGPTAATEGPIEPPVVTAPVSNPQIAPLPAPSPKPKHEVQYHILPVPRVREGSAGYIYLGQRDGNTWAVNRYAQAGAIIDTDKVPKPGEEYRVRQDVNVRTRLPDEDAPLVMSSSLGAAYRGDTVRVGTVSKIGKERFYWAAVKVLPRPSE